MCGKTGTAEVKNKKDNSVFVAFAPRDNPKIAIAVVVENSGQGATWAAPIASFIVEQYLRGSISKRPSGIYPEYYMNANLLPEVPGSPAEKARKRADSLRRVRQDSIKKAAADTAKKQSELKAAKNKQAGNTAQSSIAMLPKRRDDE